MFVFLETEFTILWEQAALSYNHCRSSVHIQTISASPSNLISKLSLVKTHF